jgi:DNA-binding SARP family transcriptional activator/Tfp pilus assembly protein PilF
LARSIAVSNEIGYEYCLAHAILLLGIIELHEKQIEGAISKLKRSESIFERLKPPRELSIARTNLGSAFMELGDLARAREYAERAVAGARACDDLWAQGLSLQMLASIAYRQGEVKAALPLMGEALEALGLVGQHWLSAETLWRQALILRETGDEAGAIKQLERCFELTREIGAMEWELAALESLGAIAIEAGRNAQAVGYFQEVLRTAEGDTLAHIQARVLLGVIDLSLGAEEWKWAAEVWGAYEHIRDAHQLPAASEESLVRKRVEGRLSGPELGDAHKRGRNLSLEEASQVGLEYLYRLGTRALVTSPRYDLRLLGLGPTDVYRHGEQLTASDWTCAKPKELLFYLASNPPKTKEQIGLVFWPDASPDQLRAGLRAALYHLRRALGDRDWILYEHGQYRFNRDMDYWYDVDAFNASVDRGERLTNSSSGEAIEALESAIELYGGDFLTDIAEDEWASLQRESLRRRYFSALFSLSETLMGGGRIDRAVEVLNLLLSEDPLLEKAHRTLMRCYAQKGEHGLMRRQYQNLKEIMAEELGVEPSSDTASLYHSPISAEPRA